MFDFFRVLRKKIKTKDIITYVQDVIFWILTGISMLYCIYTFNNGEIRLYEFIGILLGTILYFLTVSKLFININSAILTFITKILQIFIIIPFKIIIKPFKILFYKILHKISQLKQIFLKRINKNVAMKKDFKV